MLMVHEHKPNDLAGTRPRRSPRPVLLGVILSLAATGLPRAGAVAWKAGPIEKHVYFILSSTGKEGEIEQRLEGLEEDGVRRYRATYDMVRRASHVGMEGVVGRTTVEVVSSAADFDFVRREDSYSIYDTVGRARSTRTATGVKVHGESAAQAIPAEDVDRDIAYEGHGPLLDQYMLVYLIRSQPMQEGHDFHVDTIMPLAMQTDRLAGRVGPVQTITWNGQPVQARRIDISSTSGTSAYYVREDEGHDLIRFVSPDDETYELQPPPAR
jgi:hypothetical protein